MEKDKQRTGTEQLSCASCDEPIETGSFCSKQCRLDYLFLTRCECGVIIPRKRDWNSYSKKKTCTDCAEKNKVSSTAPRVYRPCAAEGCTNLIMKGKKCSWEKYQLKKYCSNECEHIEQKNKGLRKERTDR